MNDTGTQRPQGSSDRMTEAKASLDKLQEEIAPFVKKRKFDQTTTAGQWRETDTVLTRQHAAAAERVSRT